MRIARAAVVVAAVGPLLLLPVRALADAWRAPAGCPRTGDCAASGPSPPTRSWDRHSQLARHRPRRHRTRTAGRLARRPGPRRLADTLLGGALLGAPLLVPPLAVGQGLSTWLLRLHLDGRPGVILAHLLYVIPYQILAVYPAFTAEQRGPGGGRLFARGAGRSGGCVTITMPDIRRSLGRSPSRSGFTVSWSQYGTTLGVGGGIVTLPVVLVPFVRTDPQIAAVLDLILLAAPFVLVAAAAAMDGRGPRGAPPRDVDGVDVQFGRTISAPWSIEPGVDTMLDQLRRLEHDTRPVDTRPATALTRRWDELPAHVRTRRSSWVAAPPGARAPTASSRAATSPAVPATTRRTPTACASTAPHTIREVERQMAYLRAHRGPGQYAQLIGGEVSLLDPEDHAEVARGHATATSVSR